VLTGKQRRHLRALGHKLEVVVHVGTGGLELVKIKVRDAAGVDRHDAAEELAKKTKSQVAQVLGYTVLLYRRHPQKPVIVLPKPAKLDA
jgi:RNA-binding protein